MYCNTLSLEREREREYYYYFLCTILYSFLCNRFVPLTEDLNARSSSQSEVQQGATKQVMKRNECLGMGIIIINNE